MIEFVDILKSAQFVPVSPQVQVQVPSTTCLVPVNCIGSSVKYTMKSIATFLWERLC